MSVQTYNFVYNVWHTNCVNPVESCAFFIYHNRTIRKTNELFLMLIRLGRQ